MKKSKCENKIFSIKQNRGITLIALIITIVILLILAIVAIRALSDNGGIIKKAEDVREKYIVGQEKEEIKLAQSEWAIEKYTNKTKTFKGFMESRLSDKASVFGNDKGPLTVTFKSSGNSYIVEDEKIDGPIKDGITLNPTSLTVAPGGTGEITATITGNLSGTITWESSNINIVTVSGDNTVCTVTVADGVTEGTAKITASIDEKEYATCSVTVEESASGNLRKYVLGEDEKGLPLFIENEEKGIMSLITMEFQDNTTISDASMSLHSVTLEQEQENMYIYLKYDKDGKYYKITSEISDETLSYQTTKLEEIYLPGSSSNIGKSLTYDNKSYTVIDEKDSTFELIANYVSDPVMLGASTYEDALSDYNNVRTTLHTAARNATGLSVGGDVIGIRCVGDSGIEDTTKYFQNPDSTKFTSYTNNSAKELDLNFEQDLMKLHNAGALNASEDYWLASRCIDLPEDYVCFDIRCVDVSNCSLSASRICYVMSGGYTASHTQEKRVRPIITIKSNASGISWES